MGLSVPVDRNSVVSHLGRGVEIVVIDRVRTGRVLAFVTGPPNIANERSALEAWRGNYRICRNPDAFNKPLGAVLEMRVSIKNQGRRPIGSSHMEPTRPDWRIEPKPARWSVKT